MAISVSFPFSWAAQPGAWGPASLGTGFLYCILSPTRLIPKISLNFLCTELYNSSTPTQSLMHFRRLWNGMFDRHRAEITVMQFTGHSLPVHQFVTVAWDFNPVPYCQPNSPMPTKYRTSTIFGMIHREEWVFNIFIQHQYSVLMDTYKKHNTISYKQLTRELTRNRGRSKCCMAKQSKNSTNIHHVMLQIRISLYWHDRCLEKNCVLFYLIGLTSIWPICYQYLSKPLIVMCWYHFQSMRCCFEGRWTCPLVSETYPLVWSCRLFDQST